MKSDDLKKIVDSCLNDIVFDYNGKQCGITSTVHNYIPTFQVWYGQKTKEYDNVQDVVTDKFYDDKSLLDLLCSANPIKYAVL